MIIVPGMVIAGCSADRLLLGENHAVVDSHGARQRLIQADGKTIECWIAKPPAFADAEPQAVVMFYVGKNGRADEWTSAVADAWGDRPIEVWGVNYPGSGGSEGPAELSRIGPTALAAYDAARAAHGGKPIFIQAASLGTTAALHVAANRPVAGLILQNPPPLRQLLMGRYGWWNLWLVALPVSMQVPTELDSLANGAKLTTPAVFISSDADDVVPASYQQRVIDAYTGPKRVVHMTGGTHSSALSQEAAVKVAQGRDWMWELGMKAIVGSQ